MGKKKEHKKDLELDVLEEEKSGDSTKQRTFSLSDLKSPKDK